MLPEDRAAGHGKGRRETAVWYSRRSSGWRNPKRMWHLIEDFFEQGVVVKLFIAAGWLSVVIMIASLIELLLF